MNSLLVINVISSFLVSSLSMYGALCLAWHYSFFDYADGAVKTHERPTPPVGGIAIFFSLCLISWFVEYNECLVTLLTGSLAFLLLGVVDDLYPLYWYEKLMGQYIGVIILLYKDIYGFMVETYGWGYTAVVVVWFLAVINGHNLIDVMDGLLAVTTIMSLLGLLFFNWYFYHLVVMKCITIVLGTVLGFFLFNKPQASLYCGDAGALFLGSIIARLAWNLQYNWSLVACLLYDGAYTCGIQVLCAIFASLTIPSLIVSVSLVELFSLVCIRTYKGLAWYRPSKDHFALLLLKKGGTKNMILGAVIFFSGVIIIMAFLLTITLISYLKIKT
ncbi:MAG: MraY family glycosyltransferase [Candidatus Babeliales bacterium]